MQYNKINSSETRNRAVTNFQDPSLSSHIESILSTKTSLPRLKYSLACIANTLNYNNSNRHYNIQYLQKSQIFKKIVKTISNNQDLKIVQECLSILNILLNEGSDLTINQEHQIMHSLTYVQVQTQSQKGFITDKLVQQILLLTYKLKTKNQLSQFIATLMVQKMSAFQAKRFLKQLRKQQLKNISVADLIKIGLKFKTNVHLMNQILNLLYEKIFSKKDKNDLSKIAQFLPKIVQENIEQQTISYKCLLLYKLSQKVVKIDPITQKYLKSLLKYKKQLFLPLKRQFINNESDLIKIIEYGSQFQIYHLLIIDYLIKHGFNPNWQNVIQFSQNKKNIKLKQICLRVAFKYKNGKFKYQITEDQQINFLNMIPIQGLRHTNCIIQKLQQQPNMTNCIYAIKNLPYFSKVPELLLSIHRIALKNKQYHIVEQLQKIVILEYNQKFVYEKIKQITKIKHKIVLKGQLYFIWIPLLVKNQKLLKNMQNQVGQIMSYQSIDIQHKFYVLGTLLQYKLQLPLMKFILFLNRQIQSINLTDDKSKQQAQTIFTQLKFYLKKFFHIYQNKEVVNYFVQKVQFHLERTIQLLFSKLVQIKNDKLTLILFELQKYNFYGENWKQSYRWILTALQNITQQDYIYLLDCLEIFQMAIQNIRTSQIPDFVKSRFSKILQKNWSKFHSQHLFAIQRIIQILWPQNQIPFQESLGEIEQISTLMKTQQQFNKRKQYFFQSEHPTSQFLIKLTQSHFFGICTQQNFIKCLLQLSDKKYADVKRFTQKNVILMMNFIIWVYQYSQEDMDSRINDMIIAFLSYKGQGSNQISSYNIRKKCIQIVANISHSINLLKLPIKQLLQTYIGQIEVMRNLNQILKIIIQSKPSFLQNLNLGQIIQSVMISLITCQNIDLIQEYINFIQALCYIQGSKYNTQLQDSLGHFCQIIKIQRKVIQIYRKSLISFILQILHHYQFEIENDLIWFLMNKYFIQEDIQIILLSMIEKNIQKQKQKQKLLQYSNQKLLVRLIMHHNQNNQIINKVQGILQNSKKQMIIKNVNQESNKSNSQIKKIKIQPQQQFISLFKSQQYFKCQQLLNQIRNPLLITFTKQQLRKFLNSKDLQYLINLIDFLYNNPVTKNVLINNEQFFITKQCFNKIMQINQKFNWINVEDRNVLVNFNQKNVMFQYQKNQFQENVSVQINSLFNSQFYKTKIILFLNSLKSRIQKIQTLSFYSKFIHQNQQKSLLKSIINQIKLQQTIDFMKINLSYKLNIIQVKSSASQSLIINHLKTHLESVVTLGNYEENQNYTNQLIFLLTQSQLQRNKQYIIAFFVQISKLKIQQPSLITNLMNIVNKFFQIFQNKSDLKNNQIHSLLQALIFMWRNNQNYKIGLISKIFYFIQNKVTDSQIYAKAYKFLNQNSLKLNQSRKEEIKQINNNKQKQKSPQKINQSSQKSNVVFAKQISKQEEQIQEDKQANQAYKKVKQLEQYTSIKPKPKLKQQIPKKVQTTLKSIDQQIKFQQEQQNLIRPKQLNFDQNNFYEKSVQRQSSSKNINQSQRKQMLQNIKSKQKQQISITTLKQHAKFITSLMEYDSLSQLQLQELMKSLDNITQTVQQHHYYVKKICQLQVTFKLIKLFKRKQIIIAANLQHYKELFEKKLLKLHHAMSFKKQKKTIIFDDQLSIQFFKLILSQSIKTKAPRQANLIVIDIIVYCMKNLDAFFKQGLLSMIIQMCKLGINTQQILNFLSKIDLNKHIIYQIYSRGMLNRLIEVFQSANPTNKTNLCLNLWIKLAGKMCINQSIQDKYYEKNIHKLLWQKYQQLLSNQLDSKINIAYFFALMTKKNKKVAQYIIQNQILEKVLTSLQNQNCEQLYLLFYNIKIQNESAISYCFRIKYHNHLIEKITLTPDKAKSKYFYKSLGKILTDKSYHQLFFKEKIVQKLTNAYQIKTQPSIYQCLLDFIITLETDKEFQEIKKQNFWKCLSLFEYKLSSQATYAYILQIFLVMIKKGRIKQFNTAQIRGKVTLKAEYSINLDGKQLALRFIVGLSLKIKQCYVTERCLRLLSSIVSFKVTQNQLSIIQDLLQTDGMNQNYQFLGFFAQYQITQIICNRFKQFIDTQLISTLKIFNIIGKQSKNIQIFRDKIFIPVVEMLKSSNYHTQNATKQQIVLLLFKLMLLISSFRQNYQTIQKMQMGTLMIQILDKVLQKNPNKRKVLLQQFLSIIDVCRKNQLIPLLQIQKIIQKLQKSQVDKELKNFSQLKQTLQGTVASQTTQIIGALTEGIKVKMYKSDGSHSQLLLFLTQDKLELNCVIQKKEPVKQKWRLPLNQISNIQIFLQNNQYQKSAFYKSAGIFSSAPDKRLCLTLKSKNNQFNILFETKQLKQKWKKYIDFAIDNSKKILKQFQ